jgi:predicted dehydrogenase
MQSLIVGMGIGQLYKTVLENLGHTVITVDNSIGRGAMLPSVEAAILVYGPFDTVHICTPNYTHYEIAVKLAPHAKIIFIEKPGVINAAVWRNLSECFPETRFMMVKNNMWRDNINVMRELAMHAKTVNINWINYDRVPNPGSWFTNKRLSYGGVSRDLMPHLLSLYMALEPKYEIGSIVDSQKHTQWQLRDLMSTEYGTVNPNGVYDVDDIARISILNKGRQWELCSQWRSMNYDNRSIEFGMTDGSTETIELGLCPESAYQSMIKEAVERIDDGAFWQEQFAKDMWIHERIDAL